MTSITQKIMSRVNKPAMTTVYVEKSSVAPNGKYAKVLFRLATSKDKAKEIIRNRKDLIESFSAKLNGSARLVTASVHPSGTDGFYCGYIKLNDERMSFDVAQTKNFHAITANMFVDPEDNIWNLEESADGKILIRNSEDNLQEILNSRMASPSLSVAAAGYDLNGAVVTSQIVAYYNNVNEEICKGMAVDKSAIYDFKYNKIVETASCDLVAACDLDNSLRSTVTKEINKIFANLNVTYNEVDPTVKQKLRSYLSVLYGQNKAFLSAYLSAIDNLLEV